MECPRCRRPLLDCAACNAGLASRPLPGAPCSPCGNTGLVCPEHGGRWAVAS